VDRAQRLYLGVGVPLIDRITGIGVVHRFLVVMHLNGMLGGNILASGIATRALFALLPGLLVLVAFVGFLVRDPAVQQQVVDLIAELVPPLQDLIGDSLTVISQGAVPFTILGLLTLRWAASGFFQTLEVAFAVVLGVERRRDPIVRGLIGVAGVAVILAAVGAGIIAMLAATAFAPEIAQRITGLALGRVTGTIILAAVAVAGAGLAYRFIPATRPSWAEAAVPAVFAGLAITLLTELFTLIAPFLAGTASLYGAIAAIFVLLAWLQLCAQVIVMGMVWVRIRMQGMPELDELPWPTGSLRHPGRGGATDATETDATETAAPGDAAQSPPSA
jgi:membrane protein